MTAAERPDGFVVTYQVEVVFTYQVEVVFDTNAGRTGYDHVGTVARCTCGHKVGADSLNAPLDALKPLIRHARSHEPA